MTVLLEVEGVRVRFGGLQALSGVSLHVENGEIAGLIGPNGAGKTTLLHVISGLQPPVSGRVRLRGTEVSGLAPWQRTRLGIGRTFQTPGLIPTKSVETNILAGRHQRAGYGAFDPLVRPWRWKARERRLAEEVSQILARFAIEPHRHTLVGNLSVDAARLVELATVLAESPTLLLLDEPTAGLDPDARGRLASLLEAERREGRTTLLVSHDVGFVRRVCDRVLVLAGGRVIAEGAPSVVLRDERVVEVYLGRRA